jgi:hypothetical protein
MCCPDIATSIGTVGGADDLAAVVDGGHAGAPRARTSASGASMAV